MKSAVWGLVIVVVLAATAAQAASDSAVLRPFMTFEGERGHGGGQSVVRLRTRGVRFEVRSGDRHVA